MPGLASQICHWSVYCVLNPLFVLGIGESLFENGLSDKTLLWRMTSHLSKWEREFRMLIFEKNDAWTFFPFVNLKNACDAWHWWKEKIFFFLFKFWKDSKRIIFHFSLKKRFSPPFVIFAWRFDYSSLHKISKSMEYARQQNTSRKVNYIFFSLSNREIFPLSAF